MSTFPEAGKGVHAFFRFQNQQNPDQISCFIIVLKFQDVQESDSKHILLDPPEKKKMAFSFSRQKLWIATFLQGIFVGNNQFRSCSPDRTYQLVGGFN